jgi:hypothetical protein
MLDVVRSFEAPTKLAALVRTADPGAELQIAVEVDDTAKDKTWATIVIGTIPGSTAAPVLADPVGYRLSPARARAVYGPAPRFGSAARLAPDGRWHMVNIDVAGVIRSGSDGQYSARRVPHVRLIGSLDVRRVDLT